MLRGGFLGRALFLHLDFGFGHHVGDVFTHAVDTGQNLVAQAHAGRQKVGRQGLDIKLAARQSHGTEGAHNHAARKNQTVLGGFVHFVFLPFPMAVRRAFLGLRRAGWIFRPRGTSRQL